jgi:thioredoxin reductase
MTAAALPDGSLDPTDVWDAAVVGGGPAGLSAATWLARYRRTVVVLDSQEYRNRWVDNAHGYLGSDPMPPKEFLARSCEQLDRYDYATRRAPIRVLRAEGSIGRFELHTDDDGCVVARRIVLCTGVQDAFPVMERFFDFYGADIFHCSSCDGYEARGKDVVVFGWGDHIVGFALELLDWAKSVTVVTEGHELEADDAERMRLSRYGIDVVEDDAVALRGERGELEAVLLRSGGELACQLAFFSIAHHPVNDLAQQLGCALTDEGCVRVDDDGCTSVEGVYAAGDLTPGVQLVSAAVAKGAVAGIGCARTLTPDRP